MQHLFVILSLLVAQLSAADVQQLIADLSSADYQRQSDTREGLVNQLAKASAPDAPSAEHQAALGSVHAALRGDATDSAKAYLIQMLGLYGDEQSARVLAPFLGHTNTALRERARKALARLHQTDAPALLMDGLLNGPPETRPDYIQALAYIGHTPAWEPIAKLLSIPDPQTQAMAAWALGQLGAEEAQDALWDARTQAPDGNRLVVETALLQLSPDIEKTEALARDGSFGSVRIGAFRHLIKLDPTKAVSFLQAVLADHDATARPGIIRAAMASTEPSVREALIHAEGTLSDDEKVVLVGAVADQRASQYEPLLVGYLDSDNLALSHAAADALGWVGGDASFEAMIAYMKQHTGDQSVAEAMARLNAPKADEYFLSLVQNPSDPAAALLAVEIIRLRNSPGGTDALNALALKADDPGLKEAAFGALEVIGDMRSIQILLGIIMEDGPLTRPAQRSLKRLSDNYGAPETQWSDAYLPALESARTDKQKELVFLILDGVACQAALDYLAGHISNPSLKPVVLKTLQRWPDYQVAVTWVELSESAQADASLRKNAADALRRTFNSSSMNGEVEDKAKWAAKALAMSHQPEIKQSIASGFDPDDMKRSERADVRKALKSFEHDADVKELLTPFFN